MFEPSLIFTTVSLFISGSELAEAIADVSGFSRLLDFTDLRLHLLQRSGSFPRSRGWHQLKVLTHRGWVTPLSRADTLWAQLRLWSQTRQSAFSAEVTAAPNRGLLLTKATSKSWGRRDRRLQNFGRSGFPTQPRSGLSTASGNFNVTSYSFLSLSNYINRPFWSEIE